MLKQQKQVKTIDFNQYLRVHTLAELWDLNGRRPFNAVKVKTTNVPGDRNYPVDTVIVDVRPYAKLKGFWKTESYSNFKIGDTRSWGLA